MPLQVSHVGCADSPRARHTACHRTSEQHVLADARPAAALTVRCVVARQVHVSHAAVSHMLVNVESLRGIAPRIRTLAAREAAVSAAVPPLQQVPPLQRWNGALAHRHRA